MRILAPSLIAAGAGALLWSVFEPVDRPPATDEGALRVHVPFPITGPRDIRGVERATRTYRAISPHAPQPISDVIAQIVAAAAKDVNGADVGVVRQPSARNELDVSAFDSAPAAHASVLILSHEAIVPLRAERMLPAPQPPSVAPIALMPLALLASPRLPPELQRLPLSAASMTHPLRIGSAGGRSASRIAAGLLAHSSRIEHLQLTYNGGQAALNALAASEIDLMFAALPLVLPYIEAGRMPAIALTSPQRFPLLPNLPTVAEQGAIELTWEGWFGVYASRRMAARAREQLIASLTQSLATRAVRAGLLQQGLLPTLPDPEAFAPRLRAERDRAAAVLAAAQ